MDRGDFNEKRRFEQGCRGGEESSLKEYVLGLDGGGTKTLAAAEDLAGRELFRLEGGALNPNGEAPAAVKATLAALLSEAARKAGPGSRLAAVCVGAAGVSNPAARALLEQSMAETGFAGAALITGDHAAALAGALGRPEGMILISGTGSVCFGCAPGGREARAGGRGHLIDDEGSGYAMGRDVLRAVVRAEDGRCPATCLAGAVSKALGIGSMDELIRFVYAPGRPKRELAALARLLPAAAEQGDAAALKIYERAGRELALLADTVARRLGLGAGELALAGGVLRHDGRLRETLIKRLALLQPGLHILPPQKDAASGAALLARRLLKDEEEGGR